MQPNILSSRVVFVIALTESVSLFALMMAFLIILLNHFMFNLGYSAKG
jgi:F0F1-type ATP synthase membrane subunit c/vacuolar-type H+-ATPase subunit K